MMVCCGLRLYCIVNVIFMCIYAWSEGKSCVVCHVALEATYRLAKNISEEVD